MVRPTPHNALEGMGFKLVGSGFNGSSDRIGTAMTHHYTTTRSTVGKNNIVRPITHHVFVDEFSKNPGKYNVSYHVTQDGGPYAEGDFDTLRRHKDNVYRGSEDPIKDIMTHHQGVTGSLNREQAQPLIDVNNNNIHRLTPGSYHVTPGWGEDDPKMKSTRYIHPGPEHPMVHLNSASEPVSDEDWQSFVSGRNPVLGMMPNGTPVVDHFDPNFGHMGPENPRGGRTFINLPHAVQRGSSGEPEVYEPQGNCVTCGKPTWNTAEGGQSPDWEHTGNAHIANEYDMHGPDVPQCVNCANNYDTYKEAIRAGERPGGIWHHPGERPNTCDQCSDDDSGHSIMERADDDLRP